VPSKIFIWNIFIKIFRRILILCLSWRQCCCWFFHLLSYNLSSWWFFFNRLISYILNMLWFFVYRNMIFRLIYKLIFRFIWYIHAQLFLFGLRLILRLSLSFMQRALKNILICRTFHDFIQYLPDTFSNKIILITATKWIWAQNISKKVLFIKI